LKKTPNTNVEGMSADKMIEMYLVQINKQSPFSHSGGKRRITNKNKKKIVKRKKTMKRRQ